jgi:small subunit ribosomal protein S6
MNRKYELTYVIRLESNDDATKESINQVHSWIEEDGVSKIIKADHWGRRKLAYEINGQREGYYVVLEAEIDTNHLPELERNLKLSESVLRYLVIRPD